MFDLSGKTALVTGAGQSVGAGIAMCLAGQGAHVNVNDIVVDRAAATVEAITAAGGQATATEFDVTDPSAVERALADLRPVDILVNNAGNAGAHTFAPKPFVEMDPSEYARFLDVNLHGVLHCCRAVVPGMYARGWGRVITISSGAGISGAKMGISVYGAGKGGAIAFMRHLAMESASRGVTANSLALGLMANTAGGDFTAQMAKTIPVGRLGTPEDVGAACVWLASDEASWVTGKTIALDGGSIST
jgi:NAD(P)-dependent dehydrogenase (short-subunit alcohol dehydrogenase family)